MSKEENNIAILLKQTLLNKLLEEQKSTAGVDSVSVFLSLRAPPRLGYKISAVSDDEKLLSSNEELFQHNKIMEMFDGITAEFDFSTEGNARILDENYKTKLLVNPLGTFDYITAGRAGTIGDGFGGPGLFLFRLLLPSYAVRDIIEKATIFDKAFSNPDNYEDDAQQYLDQSVVQGIKGTRQERKEGEDFLVMRLDIVVDDELIENTIRYKIVRLYM